MKKREDAHVFGSFLILLACLTFFVDLAGAADYPKGPITLTIPFSQGGATDTSARAIAAVMEAQLKVPVVCENKLGGGGAVGFAWLARQKPDGMDTTSGLRRSPWYCSSTPGSPGSRFLSSSRSP